MPEGGNPNEQGPDLSHELGHYQVRGQSPLRDNSLGRPIEPYRGVPIPPPAPVPIPMIQDALDMANHAER